MHTALTISGSDSSGGAGIQADLRTFAAYAVHGLSALTAITAQNTRGISEIFALPPSIVGAQIDAVASEFAIGATKIGMLANERLVDVVAECIARHALRNVVLDPVLAASTGAALLDPSAIPALLSRLLPRVAVVTPNVPEAERLTGLTIRSVADAVIAARALVAFGAHAAIVTGGHLIGEPTDVLFDGNRVIELTGARVHTPRTHGTGCAFASALAAGLARGEPLEAAARAAKAYVVRMLEERIAP